MPIPEDHKWRYIFHFTDIRNLDSIIKLIPGDVTYTDDFFVHLPIGVQEVNIDWKLLSRHYSEKGTLKIIVEDDIQYDYEYSKARAGEEVMVDFVEKEDILG